MRFLFLLASIFFIGLGLQAQNIEVYGKITDTSGQPLPGATIKYQFKEGTIADVNGNFYFETPPALIIKMTVRYIGYKTIDTLIMVDQRKELFLEFQMTQELFELPDIEITADYQNVFDDYRYHIIDFTISNDLFYLIIKKGRKSFLSMANMNGTILEEHELKGGYTRFYNSCLGGMILVTEEICAELHNLDDKLFITNEFGIDYFNKYIIPCKLQHDKSLIFKNISRHNKKIDYLQFEENKNPVILYTVHDHVGEAVSQSYFSDIIQIYYMETGNVGLEDIDYGFERENIIDDGAWSGDLQDLITTNNTHKLVLQYQALGLKKVKSDLFVVDGEPYIFDDFNKQIVLVNNNMNTFFHVYDFDLDDIKIISDNSSQTYFQKGDELYEVSFENDELAIEFVRNLEHCFFNDRNLLYKGTLYRLGRKAINKVQKTIFRDQLD